MSLQALLCMIIYTQGASMMSTCYSYICMAVAASLQKGLFTEALCSVPDKEKAPARAISMVLFIMDAYVTTALGLPRTLRDIDIHCLKPVQALPENAHHLMSGTYAHAQLAQILASTVENNHPVTKPIPHRNSFYGVAYAKIVSAENQLTDWFERLSGATSTATLAEETESLRFGACLSNEITWTMSADSKAGPSCCCACTMHTCKWFCTDPFSTTHSKTLITRKARSD